MNPLTIAKTMAKRGMLAPGPPAAQVKQLTALKKWGFGLAGEIRQAANRSPKTVAVIDESRGATTYAELLANSEKIAVILREMGFGPGDRLGLLARNHVQAIEVMTATSAVGIDLVLGNTGLAGPQFAVVAEQQGIKGLIHDDEFAEVVSHLPAELPRVTETELAQRVEATARPESLPVPAKGGRTIILTSGTTGTPKGVATIVFSAKAARWVADEHWHSQQQGRYLADGRYELKVPYSAPRELLMDVLHYGADAEVVEPVALREQARSLLMMALQKYEG